MNELYWLWLTTKFNGANAKIYALVRHFGSAERVYSEKSYNNINITEKEKSRLLDKDLSKANKICEEIARIGGKIIVFDDENYPQILKNTHNPPPVLYIKGRLPDLDGVLTIGVVGTRRPSDYGSLVTKRMCADLAKHGAVTVSGMAAGIDAVGAWATIEEGGIAVGVIGSGLDIAYPPENAELYQAVAEKGCIMTEFPPSTPPLPRHFPMRNRIIAGLSRGLLVTEAPERSGALITARFAMEEGRDVFAVPRNITDINYSGTNKIIQQGAKLVMNAEDILCEYPYAKRIEPEEKLQNSKALKKSAPKQDSSEKLKALGDKERAIAELLLAGDKQIDEIARETNIPVGELNTRLIMLEMKKIITKLPGSQYRINI